MSRSQNIERILKTSRNIVLDTTIMYPFLVFLVYGKKDEGIAHLERIIIRLRKRIIITPHILSEVGNLARRDFKDDNYYSVFIRSANETIRRMDELFVGKEDIIEEAAVTKFGYTDISLIGAQQQSESSFILSDDIAFVSLCRSRDIPALSLDELVHIKAI